MKNMTKELLDKINEIATPVKIMHVCGSHEHAIMENGIRKSLQDPAVRYVLYLPVKLTNV